MRSPDELQNSIKRDVKMSLKTQEIDGELHFRKKVRTTPLDRDRHRHRHRHDRRRRRHRQKTGPPFSIERNFGSS